MAEGSQDPGGAARSHVQFALEQTDKERPKLESRTGTDYWKTRPVPNGEHSHFVLSGPIFCIDIHENNLPVHIYIYMYELYISRIYQHKDAEDSCLHGFDLEPFTVKETHKIILTETCKF